MHGTRYVAGTKYALTVNQEPVLIERVLGAWVRESAHCRWGQQPNTLALCSMHYANSYYAVITTDDDDSHPRDACAK